MLVFRRCYITMQFVFTLPREHQEFVRITYTEAEITELVRAADGTRSLAIGLGKKKSATVRHGFHLLLRRIIAEARARALEYIIVRPDDLRFSRVRMSPAALGEMAAREMMRAAYEFDVFKTQDRETKKHVRSVFFDGSSAAFRAGVLRGTIVGDAINGARTLANTPGGDMTPALLAKAAVNASSGSRITVKTLGTAEMKKLNMGAILGVAKGSTEEPRFIIMEYWGAGAKKAPVVLVGKGVTFDSGGINLKPTGSLEDMYMDMSGAATVIHALAAAAALKVKKNIVALIPAVENMVSGSSYRPGDILKSMSGITIEIGNTDAEGRVILADALTYASRYKPKLVVDVATLTGAAMVALGQRASAIFSNRDSLVRRVQILGEAVGEYVWPLPLWDEYAADIKATFADISNSGSSRWGGAIKGAMFLKRFADDYPWVHIDMAPRMTSIDGDYLAKGATGEPVALLVELIAKS